MIGLAILGTALVAVAGTLAFMKWRAAEAAVDDAWVERWRFHGEGGPTLSPALTVEDAARLSCADIGEALAAYERVHVEVVGASRP